MSFVLPVIYINTPSTEEKIIENKQPITTNIKNIADNKITPIVSKIPLIIFIIL